MADGAPPPPPLLSPAEEQERWLQDAFKAVKQHAFFMRRALDENNLREALKHSSAMLGELRTSLLSPQRYYALYMRAFDELRHLETFFAAESKRGRPSAELYELVQHAGNILPRMYLLITVGSVYIKSKEGAAKDVLKDLVEMTRGVQHPVRGLFLRTYLTQVSKNLLPDKGSEYEGEGGSVQDAVEFVLQNFTEMNKLWVRMQYQGPAREKEKRERERQELRDLVGRNLLVLSQLEGCDLGLYESAVLPRVLEQVVNCKDELAQPYLMDALIQVFPDEYHLKTLPALLAVCPQLQPGVRVGSVLAGLMTRLAKYAADSPAVAPQFHALDAFGLFSDALAKVTASQPDMAAAEVVAMYASLMTFAIQVHREQLEYVNVVLEGCAAAAAARPAISDAKAVKQLVALLTAPLDAYDVVAVLSLGAYPKVMGVLERRTRRQVAVTIVRAVLRAGTPVAQVEQVDMLFQFIALLIRDEDDDKVAAAGGAARTGGAEAEEDVEEWEEQQSLVARLVHQLTAPAPDAQYRMLLAVRRHFGAGGPRRLPHTLPPLVFAGLALVRRLRDASAAEAAGADAAALDTALKKLFQFLHQTVAALAEVPRPEAAMRLFLHCAQAASDAGLETIAYEFVERAVELFEESIPDSKAQVTALQLLTGTLVRCAVFSGENREALVHKATSSCSRLVRKADQCRAAAACAHLFWPLPAGAEGGAAAEPPAGADSAAVLTCLKRALKTANAAQQAAAAKGDAAGSAALFVEALNAYLVMFDRGVPSVDAAAVQALLDLVANEAAGAPAALSGAEGFWQATLRHIAARKADAATAARYAAITLPAQPAVAAAL